MQICIWKSSFLNIFKNFVRNDLHTPFLPYFDHIICKNFHFVCFVVTTYWPGWELVRKEQRWPPDCTSTSPGSLGTWTLWIYNWAVFGTILQSALRRVKLNFWFSFHRGILNKTVCKFKNFQVWITLRYIEVKAKKKEGGVRRPPMGSRVKTEF